MSTRLWLRSLFWRKTLDDLSAEMKAGTRRIVSREELELAKALTRRRMPTGLRYPRGGEVYEATTDVVVTYMTAHHAPFTGGGKAMLPRGERVRVSGFAGERPISVYCDPLRYDALHQQIVPAEERANAYYSNYYLCIETVALNRSFRRIDGGAAGR